LCHNFILRINLIQCRLSVDEIRNVTYVTNTIILSFLLQNAKRMRMGLEPVGQPLPTTSTLVSKDLWGETPAAGMTRATTQISLCFDL